MKILCWQLGLAALVLSACAPARDTAAAQAQAAAPAPCPVSELVRETPPKDPHADPFDAGPWFVNAERTLWALWSAGWQAGPDGNKVIWIRPAGAALTVTGRRLDGAADPLRVEIPGGYGTGFQVTGVYVPAAGCWEITAQAGEHRLQFVAAIPAGADQ